MKVAIDARLYGIKHAGIGRYVERLLFHLIAHTDVSLVLILDEETELTYPKDRVEILRTSIPHYSLAEQTRFLSILNSIEADVFHFPHFNLPINFSKPYVVTIHDLLWHQKVGLNVTTLPAWIYTFKYLGYRLVINRAIRRANHIITPTHFVKDEVVKTFKLDTRSISVTYEAVDQGYFSSSKTTLDARIRSKITHPYVMYTGSLYPHKNVTKVVDALGDITDVQLVISSARNVFSQRFWEYVCKVKMQDRVVMLGRVSDDDLVSLYKNSIALIQPSLSEGFGLTGLEAMATSTAVICSDLPVFREIYGNAPLFTDTTNSKKIAAAIEKLQNDATLRKKAQVRGYEKASQYSWKKMALETYKIYAHLYEKRS